MPALALYDTRGQAQRIAQTSNTQPFLDAGFVEISQATYNQLADIVPEATVSDLPILIQAREVLSRVATATRTQRNVRVNLDALERLQAKQREKLRGITQQRLDAKLTTEQWYRQFVNTVNAGNIAATGLVVGSLDNLSSEDVAQIERDNAIQLGYVNRFRRELDTLSPAIALNRSGMYAGAMTSRYWTAHTRAMGLPQLPAIPGVRTTCGSNCKCNWNIIELAGVGNWDLQWRVSSIEQCPECEMRQRVFNPLQIRNGVIQPFNPNGIYK